MRAELLAAEQDAKNKKRKAEGKPPLSIEDAPVPMDDESNKRRKLLQEALELDKDDEDEDEGEGEGEDDKEVLSEEDSDDEEDDTAELLRELEKIKRERAEEKARVERDQSASEAASREAEIATGNPLLNLAAALGQQTPAGVNTTVPGTFQVKKRWDDGWLTFFLISIFADAFPDVIFKNQAMNQKTPGQGNFVNDLLRTEFHRFVRTFSMSNQVLSCTVQEIYGKIYQGMFTTFTSLRVSDVVISELLYYLPYLHNDWDHDIPVTVIMIININYD